MLILKSKMAVADNTGAKSIELIGIPGRGNKRVVRIGDIFTGVVKAADPHSQVAHGDVVPAVVVRTRKEFRRNDGSYIRFDDNACVILVDRVSKAPRGTRVFGPIAREIKEAGFNKIASLASEIY